MTIHILIEQLARDGLLKQSVHAIYNQDREWTEEEARDWLRANDTHTPQEFAPKYVRHWHEE